MAYLSSFSPMDINKHFPPIGYKSLTFKNELLHCVLFIFCKICNYATTIWDIHTPVQKFGPVLIIFIKEINTFIQQGCI